ncbi:MAG: hypothetical protein D6778_03510 [Nitrospirae bacterium]|nr:MAG: hypothetical protein D6778_03510 [Nitrospirota bacterium]
MKLTLEQRRLLKAAVNAISEGFIVFLLSIAVIVIQDHKGLLKRFITHSASAVEIFPLLTFVFSFAYIWYWTYRATELWMRRRLQIYIGYTRAILVSSSIILGINYL